MSLVEKALHKLQATRQPQTQPMHVTEQPPLSHTPAPSPQERAQKTSATGSTYLEPPRPTKTVRIDRDALRVAGLLPPDSEAREVADQFRAIKRPLIRRALELRDSTELPGQLVMLASALPGDGKTFTTINLALSMALERNFTVLLVDADVAKPHVTRLVGAEDEPGLIDVLSDPSRPVESVILGTDIPSLHVLPAGRATSTATEWIASDRMREVGMRLAALYQRGVVLFDSSPILLTNEPRVLAPLVGQIIVVVKAGVTPQQAVHDSVEILNAGTRVSLVLNEAPLSGPMGYYYGHRYGYGSRASVDEA